MFCATPVWLGLEHKLTSTKANVLLLDTVIPAQAGTHTLYRCEQVATSANMGFRFAGMTAQE